MLRPTLVAALIAAYAAPVLAETGAEGRAPLPLVVPMPGVAEPQLAQQPLNLLPPPRPREVENAVPPADRPLLEEPSPSFQPIRPAEEEAPAAAPEALVAPPTQVQEAPPPAHQPAAREPEPLPPASEPAQLSAPIPPAAQPFPSATAAEPDLPAWGLAVLLLGGAFLAGLFGILTALFMRRAEARARRRSVAATLAIELETRRLAFEAVPLPPNVEAGVSFVSAVTSLAGTDAGFRSVQGNIHLLPENLAAHVAVHYAAVQRVSDFVKGQSLAAAVRMLQANRLGGYPCPDAGAMREAHVELGAAFRGVDKLVQALRKLR